MQSHELFLMESTNQTGDRIRLLQPAQSPPLVETANASGCATGKWVEKPVRLKFSFAGILLHATTFRSVVLSTHFSRLSTDPAELEPPLQSLPACVQAAVVYSHPVAQPLRRISFLPGTVRYASSQYRRFYVNIEGSFKHYLGKFSAQRRSHLNRRVRKLAELNGGSISWREYCRPDEMAEFYELARRISQKTYQERLVDAGLPSDAAFRESLTRLAECHRARGYILFCHETPIAYQFCPAEAGVLTYERVGYDPAFRQYAPGNVLLYLTLERLFAERAFQQFDFGKGEYPYKELFSTGSIRCADIYYLRLTLRNVLLVACHSALGLSTKLAAKLLGILHLKQKLRTLIRAGVGGAGD